MSVEVSIALPLNSFLVLTSISKPSQVGSSLSTYMMETLSHDRGVDATTRYARADDDALLHEKAYVLNYDTPPEIFQSNFLMDFFLGIKVHSLRTKNLNHRENNPIRTSLSSCMRKEDFDQEEKLALSVRDPSLCSRDVRGGANIYLRLHDTKAGALLSVSA